MDSWLLPVYFYFPCVASCLTFWCCLVKARITKVAYKLIPRRGGRKGRKPEMVWRCLCLLWRRVPFIHLPGQHFGLHLKYWSKSLSVTFVRPFALWRQWKWDALSLLFSSNRFEVIAKVSSCPSVFPVKLCALLISVSQDRPDWLPWDNPSLAMGLSHLELHSPLSWNVLKTVLPATKAAV